MLVKQLALLERHPELRAGAASERWAEAARRAADALVKLWERNKQLGQFVDIESGELVVGGSTSAGLAPAGLALAAAQLKQPLYLATAKAMGEHYYERFVRVGLTCGGPGDVLQAPDSQSAAALLDSFVTLFEATRDRVWIDRARAAAHLLASWVIAYDAPAAGRGRCRLAACARQERCSGAPAARRGSPGLRAVVGRRAAAPLPRDRRRRAARAAARHRPQPGAVPAARHGERPKLAPSTRRPATARAPTPGAGSRPGDSVVPEDGVFDAIGLLSYTEVPGIYVRLDTGFVFVFDHVTARIKERTRGRLVLAVANPTKRGRDGAHPRRRRRTAPPSRCVPGPCSTRRRRSCPRAATIQVSVPPL